LWFDATDDELREYIQKIFLETVVLDESWKEQHPRFDRRDAILCSAGLFFSGGKQRRPMVDELHFECIVMLWINYRHKFEWKKVVCARRMHHVSTTPWMSTCESSWL
jgi:hypothetical protein